jgi:hypothetical protein
MEMAGRDLGCIERLLRPPLPVEASGGEKRTMDPSGLVRVMRTAFRKRPAGP